MFRLTEYHFKIQGKYSAKTFPMGRFAKYLMALADLFGNDEYVHFSELKDGSAVAKVRVDPDGADKVIERLTNPPLKKFNTLDKMLADDDSEGVLEDIYSNKIINFPGRKPEPPNEPDKVIQSGFLDGMVFQIGGTIGAKTMVSGPEKGIPFTLKEGQKTLQCHTDKSTAQELGKYLLGPHIRVQGRGVWQQKDKQPWKLAGRFWVDSFQVLDDAPLTGIFQEAAKVANSRWGELEDPLKALWELRDQGEED